MGGFQVPITPQQVAAPQGVQGGVVGTNPTAQNRVPQSTQVVQGLQQLMTGFVGMQRANEDHYKQKVYSAVQDIANGLNPNPDYDEIMKWAKKANMGFKTDLTPAQADFQKTNFQQQQYQQTLAQAQQAAQQNASGVTGMPPQAPGPMGSPGQPGVAAPGVVAPPSPQNAPPGFLDRVKHMLGMQVSDPANYPSPSAQSPFGQQLQSMAGAVQQSGGGMSAQLARQGEQSVLAANVAKAAGKLGIAHNESMIPVYQQTFQKALGGDLNAMTMLRRLDIFKGVPIDEAASLYKAENPGDSDYNANAQAAKLLLWQQGGGPALQLKIADLAKDMIPRFGGDAGKAMQYTMSLYSGANSGLKPGLTYEEFDKKTAAESKVIDRYPTAPVGMAKMYGDAVMAGKSDLASTLLDFLSSHYKTSGQVSQSQFQQTLSKDYSQISATNQVENDRVAAEMLGHYIKAIDTLEEPHKAVLNDPKADEHYTQSQMESAYARLSDLQNSLAGKTIKINGKETQLAPLEDILNHTNVQTNWFSGMGPKAFATRVLGAERNVRPTGKPMGTAASTVPYQQLSPQDMQLLGIPGAPHPQDSGLANTPALQQLLMQRAIGQQ
jgi:hypothetical protein